MSFFNVLIMSAQF